jgi:hypothetical protein
MPAGLIAGLVIAVVAANVVVRRRGYSIPGKTAVRCSSGHLFMTTWIEGASVLAIRLGPLARYQRCPVGRHWAVVRPVKETELTDEERARLADGTRV